MKEFYRNHSYTQHLDTTINILLYLLYHVSICPSIHPFIYLIFYFLFLKIIYLFIYFWLYWVFVSVRGLFFLVAASGGHSSSRCVGLSLSRPLLLQSTGSRRAGSVVVAHGPSCSAACGIFPDQGLNPCPLHWQADSQPLRHQGSPIYLTFAFKIKLQISVHSFLSKSTCIPLTRV